MIPAIGLLTAAGIGLLIGLERGWRQRTEHAGGRIAGIRTFSLIALGGGLAGEASTELSPWIGVVGIAAIGAALLLAHRARLNEPDDNVSATNVVVGVVTALIGLLAGIEHEREALIAGGLTVLVLSMREPLHGWLRTLEERDIRAAGQFAAIALVVLPLLPDKNIGPYDALNPRMLWLVVVFVTGLSFAGYWASKRFGSTRGTILAAAIGATYSSTAVTLELARRLSDDAHDRATLNAGIAAATAMMPIRVTILSAVLLQAASAPLFWGTGAAILFLLLYAWWTVSRARSEGGATLPASLKPFDFWPAVGFALMVGAIVVASHWVISNLGTGGISALVAVTGLYDVDAAVVTVSTLPREGLVPALTGFLLALPVLVNSLMKAVLVLALAGVRRGLPAAIPLIVSSVLIVVGMTVLAISGGWPW